jgi:hypothetical protein
MLKIKLNASLDLVMVNDLLFRQLLTESGANMEKYYIVMSENIYFTP